MGRFPCLSPKEVTLDDVEEEFRLFQSTSLDDGILSKKADEARRELGLLATGGGKLFANLSTITLGVLVIFHSHADCERVFSLVTKTKIQYRASLSTDTLSSLVTRKAMMAAKGVSYGEF